MDLVKSLYIHYPYCLRRCNYCDFFSQLKVSDDQVSYQKILDKNLDWLESFHRENDASFAPLETLYIGGGTPGLWGERGRQWLSSLVDKIGLAPNCELTLEVNPGAFSEDEARKWMEVGINRFSVGSQSLDPFYLRSLDRIHSREQTLSLLQHLKNLQVNYSVDLMLGLPFSEARGRNLEEELAPLFQLKIPHLSAYILTVEDDYCHFKDLPCEDYSAEEYLKLARLMKEAGYEHYEVSNFSLPSKASLHNLCYWQNQSVAALGSSAVGTIIRSGQTLRYRFDPDSHTPELEIIDREAQFIEKVFMGLRSSVGVERSLFDMSIDPRGRSLPQDWESRGLACHDAERIYLTSQGFLLLDSLIEQMFSYKII